MKAMLVDYIPFHAYEIYQHEVKESGLNLSKIGDWETAAEKWCKVGPAYTLLIDGKPVASGGIALLDPTYGECWLLLTKQKNGIIVFRYVLRKLQVLIDHHGFRRLQAHVIKGFDEGEELIKRLGFKREGWLEKYGPNGETYGLYARIF